MTKTCPRCKKPKDGSDRTYCKSCRKDYNADYKAGRRWPRRQSDRRLSDRVYTNTNGVQVFQYTKEELDAWVAEAEGKCRICRADDRPLRVDHDHKTLQFRGILCDNCNWGLGHFNDDTARLEAAIKYLLGS